MDRNYFLEINNSGNLLLKCQQIIGLRKLGEITEEQKDSLIEWMSQLFSEQERPAEEGVQPTRPRPRG